MKETIILSWFFWKKHKKQEETDKLVFGWLGLNVKWIAAA